MGGQSILWKEWGKSTITSNPEIWLSGWQLKPTLLNQLFNNYRSITHEKIPCAHHDFVLLNSGCSHDSNFPVQSTGEFCTAIWFDPALSSLPFVDDEIHGA